MMLICKCLISECFDRDEETLMAESLEGELHLLSPGSSHCNSTAMSPTVEDPPDSLLISILVIEGLIGLGILFTNGIVLVAFCLSTKLRERVTNYYLLQLTMADFFAGLFAFFHIAFALVPVLKRSQWGCLMYYCIMMHVCAVSMMSLMGITLDRFIAILSPFYYRVHAGMKRTISYCVVIQIIPMVVCLAIPIAWHNDLGEEPCDMVTILKMPYVGGILIPFFFIMAVVKIILYSLIYRQTRKRVKLFRRLSNSVKNKTIYQHHEERAQHQNLTLAKTGALVVSLFLICWAPFFLVMMVQVYGGLRSKTMEYARLLAFLCILLSSLLNPVIYIYRVRPFRKEVLRVICPRVSLLDTTSSVPGEGSIHEENPYAPVAVIENDPRHRKLAAVASISEGVANYWNHRHKESSLEGPLNGMPTQPTHNNHLTRSASEGDLLAYEKPLEMHSNNVVIFKKTIHCSHRYHRFWRSSSHVAYEEERLIPRKESPLEDGSPSKDTATVFTSFHDTEIHSGFISEIFHTHVLKPGVMNVGFGKSQNYRSVEAPKDSPVTGVQPLCCDKSVSVAECTRL